MENELIVVRELKAVIKCSPHVNLKISEDFEKEIGLHRIDDEHLSFTVKLGPEKLDIKDFNNIHNEIQKNTWT